MSDSQKPAIIPEEFRPPEPKPTARVKSMSSSHPGFIAPKEIRIDANFGVWVNPEAEVKYISMPQKSPQPSGTIKIWRTDKGYVVHMLTDYVNNASMFKKEIHTSFVGAGFVPVAEIK